MAQNDEHAQGLISTMPEALRYNTRVVDHDESSGYIIRMVPRGARVLDVGCGTGSIARLLIDLKEATVVGLEPHTERAKVAAESGVEMAGEFLTSEVVPNLGTFDAVLFVDVMEHMINPHEALVLAKSLLRPGGSVVISVPNVAHWTIRSNLILGRFDYASSGLMDATHLRWFTRKTIKDLFHRAGYRVVEFHASSGLFVPEYNRWPWNWLPPSLRRFVVRKAVNMSPTLFGCQHVVRAQVADKLSL